jgi:hypothetical protein
VLSDTPLHQRDRPSDHRHDRSGRVTVATWDPTSDSASTSSPTLSLDRLLESVGPVDAASFRRAQRALGMAL